MQLETILIVDDEQVIREFLHRILSKEGFHILEASHGEEALSIFRREAKNIHLVLMDISMPQMDGRTCARLILNEKPGMPIIYMSGNMDPALMTKELSKPAMAFLPKPFTLIALLSTVRRVLEIPSEDSPSP